MLLLRRKEGQWIEIKHVESGDTLYLGTTAIRGLLKGKGTVLLLCDDKAKNFIIQREERLYKESPDGNANL